MPRVLPIVLGIAVVALTACVGVLLWSANYAAAVWLVSRQSAIWFRFCNGEIWLPAMQAWTWRGLPIVPSDKVPVVGGRSKVLLLRVGEERQGVIGLYQPGLAGEHSPGLSVRHMGISRDGVASYLISLYCSLAVLTPDALAVLDDVEVDKFHDYSPKYR